MHPLDRIAILSFAVLIAGLCMLTGYWVGLAETGRSAYRQGQIDAINGKITVELKQNPDGSTSWVERKQ